MQDMGFSLFAGGTESHSCYAAFVRSHLPSPIPHGWFSFRLLRGPSGSIIGIIGVRSQKSKIWSKASQAVRRTSLRVKTQDFNPQRIEMHIAP